MGKGQNLSIKIIEEITLVLRARRGDDLARTALREKSESILKYVQKISPEDAEFLSIELVEKVLHGFRFKKSALRGKAGESPLTAFILKSSRNLVMDEIKSTPETAELEEHVPDQRDCFVEPCDFQDDAFHVLNLWAAGKLSGTASFEVTKAIGDTYRPQSFFPCMANLKLPKKRPGLSPEKVIEVYNRAGGPPLGSDEVAILGVRGYYRDSLGKPGQNDRNQYDDALFVISGVGVTLSNRKRVTSFNGNVDPSAAKVRIASLKPGCYEYETGFHGITKRNPYPALRQRGEVTVYRDQIGEDSGFFAINIHRGGVTTTSSEGCQTVPPAQWSEFIDLVYTSLGVKVGRAGAIARKKIRYKLVVAEYLDTVLGKEWRK